MAKDCPTCGGENAIPEPGDWDFYYEEYFCFPTCDCYGTGGSCCFSCHLAQCTHMDCTWCDGRGPLKVH